MKRVWKACVIPMLFSATAVLPGCTEEAHEHAAVEQNMAMIRAYVDAMNRGDASYLDEYFAPTYIYHGPGGDLDLEAFKEFHGRVLSAFPAATMSIEDIVAAGDKVVTRWKLHGVQNGEFLGIAPTGREVTISGIIISRFERGSVVEEWEEANLLGMMQQLGVMTPPANEEL